MRGLSKAAAIFTAPVLAVAHSFTTTTTQDRSHALIKLDVNKVIEDVFVQETFVQIEVLESDAACGYGNITLDGQELYQDETGFGSGSLITEHGNVVIADWKISCVEVDNNNQEQLIKFDVIYLDENKVRDVGFSVQFRQVAPVAITSIDGAEYMIKVSESGLQRGERDDPKVSPTSPGLDEELAALEMMKIQLTQLEHAIAKKEEHLSRTFNIHVHPKDDKGHLRHCDSLRCVVKSVLKHVKGMTNRVYPSNHPHHLPPPPSPPPPSEPFCHCDNLIDEYEGEFQVQPQEAAPNLDEIPEFHNINSQAQLLHGTGEEGSHATPIPPLPPPPPPPPHLPPSHGGLPLPPPSHEGRPPPPPPPPSHGKPDNHSHNHNQNHSLAGTKLAIQLFAVLIVLGLIISAAHTRCFAAAREHHRSRYGRGQSRCEKRAARRAAIRARYLALAQRLRALAQSSWRWHRRRRGGAGEDEEKEIAASSPRRPLPPPPLSPPPRQSSLLQQQHHYNHLLASDNYAGRGEGGQEEEEARHYPSYSRSQDSAATDDGRDSDSDSESDALSTTMEQELAQFRAVAGVVGDMIAAEEGRRLRAAQSRPAAVATTTTTTTPTYARYGDGMYAHAHEGGPPSPTSTLPDYSSMDEALPPYDEGSPDEPRFVADGFRYTPGSTAYSPGPQ